MLRATFCRCFLLLFLTWNLLSPVLALSHSSKRPASNWPTYGGDPGGQRYSSDASITNVNVDRLQQAWIVHTGTLSGEPRPWQQRASFEATPILFRNSLYLSLPFDEILALNPATGVPRWRFDPHVHVAERGIVTSRGVASWSSGVATHLPCANRIFIGTLDARLIAVDADTGIACQDFGRNGAVDLTQGVGLVAGDEYQVTSAPTVVGDVVITGSSIGDNRRVEEERGTVRAFDVRSGNLLWSWDPIPWAEHQKLRTGAANVWSTISADPENGLVFLPTSSPSPDFYGGFRNGDNADADSIVALEARTGKKLWSFQVVHHDLWDYDLASQPLLFTYRGNIPAVAIATKMGTIFVLNRITGQPLYPVTERPVPQSTIPGERTSATQPVSALPSLVPANLSVDDAWGPTDEDRRFCQDKIRLLRNDGIFTPPSIQGSLLFPGNLGGVNWGSMALDPTSNTLFVNTNRQAFLVRLSARDAGWWHDDIILPLTSLLNEIHLSWLRQSRPFRWVLSLFWPDEGFQTDPVKTLEAAHFGKEFSPSLQTPYTSVRQPLISPSGLPCNPPPWGAITAVDLDIGRIVWQTSLGNMGGPSNSGSLSLGGPIVTAGRLVFTAATKDPNLHIFDTISGRELRSMPLPASAQATPMTYLWQGRQYIVLCAGGHGTFGTQQGDSVIAFALDGSAGHAATVH